MKQLFLACCVLLMLTCLFGGCGTQQPTNPVDDITTSSETMTTTQGDLPPAWATEDFSAKETNARPTTTTVVTSGTISSALSNTKTTVLVTETTIVTTTNRVTTTASSVLTTSSPTGTTVTNTTVDPIVTTTTSTTTSRTFDLDDDSGWVTAVIPTRK